MDIVEYLRSLKTLREHAEHALTPVTASNVSPEKNAPVLAIVSPHPDDECIVGGLALRLARECGWRVVNLAVTLGSNAQRQLARAQELRVACAFLNFECHFFGERGLHGVAMRERENASVQWHENTQTLAGVLSELKPKLILAPHENDGQPTHVATHWLLRDALATLPQSFNADIAWTEYWSTLVLPNLMVSLSESDVATLVSALLAHEGEIARNPYHTTLPLWMMEAVRRGSERVGMPGGTTADMTFATLYRLQRWERGAFLPSTAGRFIARTDELRACFS